MDSYNWLGGIDPHINVWDSVISFTEFGAYEFLKAGINRPITVIPHGLDSGVFYPKDKKEARKELKLSEDIFICFNGQRNQPRKRIDITIAAFAQFAVGRPDTQTVSPYGPEGSRVGCDGFVCQGDAEERVGSQQPHHHDYEHTSTTQRTSGDAEYDL